MASVVEGRGLQLQLYILGQIPVGQLHHRLSSISIPSAFSQHSIPRKQIFKKCDFFNSDEDIFHRARTDAIQRQTWDANTIAAIDMQRNNVPTVLRFWEKWAWDLGCLSALSLVTQDVPITHTILPQFAVCVVSGFKIRQKKRLRKTSHCCKKELQVEDV